MGVVWLPSEVNLGSISGQKDVSAIVPASAKGLICRCLGGTARSYRYSYNKYGATGGKSSADHEANTNDWSIWPIYPAQYIYGSKDSFFGGVFAQGYVDKFEGTDNQQNIAGLSIDTWNLVDLSSQCPGAIAVEIWISDNSGWFYKLRPNGSSDDIYAGPSYHHNKVLGSPSQAIRIYPNSFGGAVKQKFAPVGYFTAGGGNFPLNSTLITGLGSGSWENKDISATVGNAELAIITYTANGAYTVGARGPGSSWNNLSTMNAGTIYAQVIGGVVELYRSNTAVNMYISGWIGPMGSPRSQVYISG